MPVGIRTHVAAVQIQILVQGQAPVGRRWMRRILRRPVFVLSYTSVEENIGLCPTDLLG